MESIRVFVIEDDVRVVRTLERFFRDFAWTSEASSGDEVLSAVQQFRPDIVLLDFLLDAHSSLTIIQQLKKKFPRLPILVITGSQDERHEIECLLAGADGFLKKPFKIQVLRAHVLTQVRRARPAAIDYDDGYLSISFSTRTLLKDGAQVSLTPLEWDLLQQLVKSQDPLCRDSLLSNVWGKPAKSVDALQKAVSRLRQAIEPHPRRPRYVVSVRGVGYRFLT